MEINILMTIDKNYVSQAKVSIWSMRKFTDINTKLIVTILCSKHLDQVSKDRLLVFEKKLDNLYIKFYQITESDFAQARGNENISVAAYYRLIAAEILDIDKCIYLDSDLVVCLDLNELYEIDISEHLLGGVVDMNLISRPNLAYSYMLDCNMKDFSDYINTGVLLMNLDLMREEHITNKFLSEMLEGNNPWLDQDVINRVCHERIQLIDWTFNHIVGYSDEEYSWQYGETNRSQRGQIYHWSGLNKPWNNHSFCQAKLWWNIAKEALETEIYKEYYDIANENLKHGYFYGLAENCKESKEIVIIGYSNNGLQVMRCLRRYGINSKIVFCDNDEIKRKMNLFGYSVLSVEMAAFKYKNAIWINAIQNARKEVNEQIKKLGISENQILEYYKTNSDYYLTLDEEYMKKGMEERMYLGEKF